MHALENKAFGIFSAREQISLLFMRSWLVEISEFGVQPRNARKYEVEDVADMVEIQKEGV